MYFTWQYIPEDKYELHTRCESLKSHKSVIYPVILSTFCCFVLYTLCFSTSHKKSPFGDQRHLTCVCGLCVCLGNFHPGSHGLHEKNVKVPHLIINGGERNLATAVTVKWFIICNCKPSLGHSCYKMAQHVKPLILLPLIRSWSSFIGQKVLRPLCISCVSYNYSLVVLNELAIS
jgi:hypothetical protein